MRIRISLLIADIVAISSAFLLACYWFDQVGPEIYLACLVFLGVKIFIFARMGLYHAILRYAGFPLATTIVKATSLAEICGALLVHFFVAPRLAGSIFVADYLLITFMIGFIRFSPRYLMEKKRIGGSKRVLIYGAGALGEVVARKVLRNSSEYFLVGFLDDDPTKIGKELHNRPVYGPFGNLSEILAKHIIAEVIISVASLDGERIREITRECRRNGVFCRIVPSFPDMMKQDINIQNIHISDLLRRDPKDLDEPQIRQFIKDKTILITGAGGSIGSELTRQCIQYGAGRLILVDHDEYSLYALQEELQGEAIPVKMCLANILKSSELDSVMKEMRPSIVFHAAAYKHVHIVEDNSCEGILNNVLGTIRTAQLAERHGVEKFILISTDKAVRPTSIMGASKRIAELYIQNFNSVSRVECLAVRFGNVLGSSGSVIPKFIEQINNGGPVTVTHPEVTRYFMLITEAVQLVLQAAGIGHGGEIFILNMGNPVRIVDMAEDLIFLSGRTPHKDITVEFTGLRPGEKLYEELIVDETEKNTCYENITVARATHVEWSSLTSQIEKLLFSAEQHKSEEMMKIIKDIVPEYIRGGVAQESRGEVIPLSRSTA